MSFENECLDIKYLDKGECIYLCTGRKNWIWKIYNKKRVNDIMLQNRTCNTVHPQVNFILTSLLPSQHGQIKLEIGLMHLLCETEFLLKNIIYTNHIEVAISGLM